MNHLMSTAGGKGQPAPMNESPGGGARRSGPHGRINSSSNSEDRKYTNKCTFLKRMIGDLLWENSILFERLQRKLTEANLRNEERRQLVRKLVARVNRAVLNHRRSLPPCIVPIAGGKHSIVLPSGASRVLLAPPERPRDTEASEGGRGKDGGKESGTPSRGRKKNNSDKRFVQPIPLDSMGRPIFPIELPGIEVHCLGEIDNKRSGYHSEDLLFPIGFCSSREFAAVTDPLRSCTLYTCTVNDNGPEPKFEVSGDDNPAAVYSGRTPDEAVSGLVEALNSAVAKSRTCTTLPPLPPGKGAQFFGLSIPTIHHLIQGCLGTRKCVRYKPVRYETSRLQQGAPSNHSGRNSSQASQQEQLLEQNDVHLSFRAFLAKCVTTSQNAASNSHGKNNSSTHTNDAANVVPRGGGNGVGDTNNSVSNNSDGNVSNSTNAT